jgi:hypothetical protein
MLSFDILPTYGGGIGILPWLFISFMRSPSFVLGYGGLTQFSFLIFFVGTRNPSSNQFLSPFNK